MVIEISYSFAPNFDNHFFAHAYIAGCTFTACGKSFAEAKEKMIEKLKDAKSSGALPLPPSEKVTI